MMAVINMYFSVNNKHYNYLQNIKQRQWDSLLKYEIFPCDTSGHPTHTCTGDSITHAGDSTNNFTFNSLKRNY